MKTTKMIVGLLFVILTISSCKKYPDGPAISLRSKTERVANNWRVEKAMDGSNDVTSDFERYEITFTKGHRASLSASYKFFGVTYSFITEGTWSFASSNEKLVVDYESDTADRVYIILRLKEDEMWLREEGGTLELHLVSR